MRAVVQRVLSAEVSVDKESKAKISNGVLVYLGVEKGDTEQETEWVANKIMNLRIFSDSEGRMNYSVKDMGYQILSVSQFTLGSQIKNGRRPDFTNAENPEKAKMLYEKFNNILAQEAEVETGVFGAHMEISSLNDGPVTFIIEKSF